MTMIDEYLTYQEEAEKKYGPNTIVFYENGTFYEIYGVENDEENVGNARNVSRILNIAITKKNKKILEVSRKNPLLVGVPTAHAEKHIKTLIQNGFTIVFIEQITTPPNPIRKLTRVVSPSTYIGEEYKGENSYCLGIYLESFRDKNQMINVGVGMCAYDMTTGQGTYYETMSKNNDLDIIFEEIYRFMEAIDPKEVILNHKDCECFDLDEIRDNLELFKRKFYVRNEIKKDFFKLDYQNKVLGKIFGETGMLTPIEFLNMEFKPLSLKSLMCVIDFIYEHDERILRCVQPPVEWEEQKHLILNNNTLYQLNIVPDNNLENTYGIRSLFDILNRTKTVMGKRYLKNLLLNPIVSAEVLNQKYDILERMDEMKFYDKNLGCINDLDRFFRKLSIGMLNPHELANFEIALDSIGELVRQSRSDFKEEENNFSEVYYFEDYWLEGLEGFIGKFKETFNFDLMRQFCLNDICQSFFNMGIKPELDEIQIKIEEQRNFFEKERKKLSDLVEKGSDNVKFEHNDRDGYYLKCTAKRGQSIKNLLDKTKHQYTFKNTGQNVIRINHPEIDEANQELSELEVSIKEKVRKAYIEWCEEVYKENHELFHYLVKFIGTIDVLVSNVKVCRENGYVKPRIVKSESSFLKVKGLRHPIIEKICDTLYVPNDVELDGTGMLLYGLNGGGKSSLLKAIGLSVVMAQMGLFVPCEDFEFSPFKTLYTRIMGNDNIFRGLSSFALEMTELRTILDNSNENSLILGDEICRGTEIYSALSIVSSAIKVLSEKKTNFLFATHLHKLHEIEMVKSCLNVKHYYIDMEIINGKIRFGRKIYEGIGNRLYGLEVAENIILNNEFISKASKVRKELLGVEDEIVSTKKSSYNQKVYVDKCEICGSGEKLEVHHINSQVYANCSGVIDGIDKNHIGNLVVLCAKHHLETHEGVIKIGGFRDTNLGRKLEYEREEKQPKVYLKKKKSLDEEMVEKILEYKYLNKTVSLRMIKNKIEKELGITIPLTTLRVILNGEYQEEILSTSA